MEAIKTIQKTGSQGKTTIDIYCGSLIPEREFSKEDIDIMLDNAQTIIDEVFSMQPLFEFYTQTALDDPMLSRTVLEFSTKFNSKNKSPQEQNKYENGRTYVRIGLAVLCLCSNVDVAYELLTFEPNGVIESILDPTQHFLNHPNVPIRFDLQTAYLTSLVYRVANARYPTHPEKGVVEIMSKLNMESNQDYNNILKRMLNVCEGNAFNYH